VQGSRSAEIARKVELEEGGEGKAYCIGP
jgi:hypothetical protein